MDPVFRRVLHNSVVFVVNVVGQVGIGTIAAACFAGGFPGANTMRGLLLAAWILPAWWSGPFGNGCSPPSTAW